MRKFLDDDFYKFATGQFAFRNFPDVPVKYGLTLRTPGVFLGKEIKEAELRRRLDEVHTSKPSAEDLAYLKKIRNGILIQDYLNFLKDIKPPSYNLRYEGGDIKLEYEGPWPSACRPEVPDLAIINELYCEAQMAKMTPAEKATLYAEGRKRLSEKIETLLRYPEILIADFGTRRRFNFKWQDEVVRTLIERLPKQFLGTSNVELSCKYNLEPVGTSPHEVSQVGSGIYHGSDDEIRASQNRMFELWWAMYGEELSVFLPDTYGSEFTFRTLPEEWLATWKGFRQDSGDPFPFGEKVIALYTRYGIDPRKKIIIFSDGLNLKTIIALYLHFRGKIKIVFGWGTNLTNDLGLKILSLIIKAIEANGHKLVKISDNLAKAVGDPQEIVRFKKIFSYNSIFDLPCIS